MKDEEYIVTVLYFHKHKMYKFFACFCTEPEVHDSYFQIETDGIIVK